MAKNATKNTKSKKQVEEEVVSEVDEALSDLEDVVDEIEEMSEEEEAPKAKGKGGKAKPAPPAKAKAASPAKAKPTSPAKGGKAKPASPAKGKGKPTSPAKGGKGNTNPGKGGKGKAKAAPKEEEDLLTKVTNALSKSKREGGFYNVETEKVHTKSVAMLKDYVFYTLGDDGEIRIAGTADSETLTNALEELGYADAEPDAVEAKAAPKASPKASAKASPAKGKAKGTLLFTEAQVRKLLANYTKKLTESLLAELKVSEEEEAPIPGSKGKKPKPEPEQPSADEEEVEAQDEEEAAESEEVEVEAPPKAKTEVKTKYPITLDKALGVFVDKNQYVFDTACPTCAVIGKVSGKKVIPLTAADVKAIGKLPLRMWQVVKGKRAAEKLMTQKEVDEQVKLAKESATKADTKEGAKGGKATKVEEAKTEEAEGSEAEVEPDVEGQEEGDDDGKTSEVETEVDEEAEAKAEAIRAKSGKGKEVKPKADPVAVVQKVQSQVMDKPEELTKDEFKRIYAVKMAGNIPLTQTQKVADAAGVSLAKVKSAVINFIKLSQKYADVVEAARKPVVAPPKARLDDPVAPAKGAAVPPKKLGPKN